MATSSSFSLPEAQRAFEQWAAVTGFGWESAEWGEVWQTLDDCGLLAADRLPQRALFELPDIKLGNTHKVVQLRVAMVGGALLHRDDLFADPATGTEVVAALLESLYSPLQWHDYSFGGLLVHVVRDLPTRRPTLHESPCAALASLPKGDPDGPDTLATVALRHALDDDRTAKALFVRLSADPAWATALVNLSSGRWLTYRCD